MPLKITVMFDVERSYLSVAHLVKRHMLPTGEQIAERGGDNENGHVIRVRCRSYKDVQEGMYNLKRGKLLSKEEMPQVAAIGLDTASKLADFTIRAITNSESQTNEFYDLWGKRDSQHSTQADWGLMSSIMSEICAKASSWCEDNDATFIIGAHERLAEDPMDKALKGGMNFNQKLLNEIEQNSDFVWRCFREDVARKIGLTTYPPKTYYAHTTTSDKKRTKVRMTPEIAEKMGDFRPNPNLPEMFEVLGVFKPVVLSLFGPPGGGKTTLMTSLSDPKWAKKA